MNRQDDSSSKKSGAISWMVQNRVTPNLLMIVLILGGLFMTTRITREVFPAFELDTVTISIAYPGASPDEVEQGIVLAVEEAISGISDIDEINATAGEGFATIRAELRDTADRQEVYQEIRQAVDRISTLPENAEDPLVSLDKIKRQVLRLNIFGDVSENILRSNVENVRDRLLQDDGISQVDIVGGSDYEIHISVSLETLQKYNLTLRQIAARIKSHSVELPGGKLDTSGGEILLRVKNRSSWAADFAKIPIITTDTGSKIYLSDIAEVEETFEEGRTSATCNNKRCLSLYVYRAGKETPIGISTAVREAIEEIESDLPPQLDWSISSDRSRIYKQRLELLLKNAFIGLLLVLLFLGLFLEFKLAFWVTMGIPISFLGGLLFLPQFDISINMISMFAFIIALGIVVDDAIIAGENIFEYRMRGLTYTEAAIAGARDVALPITFSILTNIIAFVPMAFVPGVMGKVLGVIPYVVITVFVISWFESLFILPAHLAYSKKNKANFITRFFNSVHQFSTARLAWVIEKLYTPALAAVLKFRYLSVAGLIAVFVITAAYVKSGRIRMILAPRVESDRAVVTATLPPGSSSDELKHIRDRLMAGLEKVAKKNGGEQLLEGSFALIKDNTVRVDAFLTDPEIRPISTGEVTKKWRQATGTLIGLESLRFESDRGGPGGGAAISVELSHKNITILDQASSELAAQLEEFGQIKDVDSGYATGKIQYNYKVNSWGESLGLTSAEVGRQLRDSFQGTIALRQQRGGNEVTVRVRLPEKERDNQYSLENMMVVTPAGSYVPLGEIATIEKSRAYTSIKHRNSRRTCTVSANVSPISETPVIMGSLNETILPRLATNYPGLTYDYKGRQADRKKSVTSLLVGFLFALGGIYCLLAIPFRSYTQPVIIMLAIPFGMIGAVVGHLIMGYNISLMSMMGIVALSGVVVNDSLVLVDYANKQKRNGDKPLEAITKAGLRRFRPVMLTTLTTVGGLAPMIMETSRQARFIIPMAISLGFGIIFATVITLVLIPSLYLIIEDFHGLKKTHT